MADYSQYQGPNPEWEKFTQTTTMPPVGLGPGETPANYRTSRNATGEAISKEELKTEGLLEKVDWQDKEIPTRDQTTIPVRIYKPKNISPSTKLPVYFFFHGGGYLFGSLDTEDANCCRVFTSSKFPLIVVHANYRHTPEHKYPTPQNDTHDALLWLEKNIESLGGDRESVIVGGISAGAGLASSVVLRAQQAVSPANDDLKIIGQVLMIPWLIPTRNYPFHLLASKDRSSYVQNIAAPVLPESQMNMFTNLLDAPCTEQIDESLCPSLAPGEKLRSIPKTIVVAAGMDPLRDEALLYADKLKKNGVPTHVHVFPGLPHGFRRFKNLQASKRWDQVITQGLEWCLSDDSTSALHVELPSADA
ncbi:hypothetical protein N7475_004261 [Penicillium sp. IBT 31633x]|nr:hypothetical protein N7475_004261 [Penicillium sp. IBT 31633x]